MKQVFKINRTVNYSITKSIIALHEEGYIYDFLLNEVDQLWNLQENRPYPFDEININRISQFDEQDGKTVKFILAIETTNGSSSAEVTNPVAVRYAWANNPVCNFYNGANLPASPFRTDNWDEIR